MSRDKTLKENVVEFRKRHGLTQTELELLLGFTSNGYAVARWERVGAPYYATLIFGLIDAYGIALLRKLQTDEGGVQRSPREAVIAFRAKHSLRGEDLDRLFGFNPSGRATRRWEDPAARGAPTYVTIMIRYCEQFGIKYLERLARVCEAV